MKAPEASSAHGRSSDGVRRTLLALGWVLLAAGSAAVAVNVLPGLQRRLPIAAILASFTPYFISTWLVSGLIFLLAASGPLRGVAALCALGLAVQVQWTSPYWPRETEAGTATAIVMTINLRCMHVDLGELQAQVERTGPDVVVVVDACVHMQEKLQDMGGLLPYTHWQETRRSRPGSGMTHPCRTAIAARGPVELIATTATENPQHTLRVELPETPIKLIAVDVANLVETPQEWAADLAAVRQAVAAVEEADPLIVLGDFNAVHEHAPMADLREEGLVDAAEQAGAGWVRTFPSDWTAPPILAIDHVLLRGGLVGARVSTFSLSGTDHLGLTTGISRNAAPASGQTQ